MKFGFLLVIAAMAHAAENTFLIRNATVHPVTSPEIAGASILVQDGRIAEIGAKIVVPKTMKIIDAKGLHVYPGMINSATEIGLIEIGDVRQTSDTTELGTFNPQLHAVAAVNPASEHIPVARANGITTVMTMPAGGIISGQASLIHLDGWTWEEMAVAKPAAMRVHFPSLSGGGGRRGGGGGFGGPTPFADRKREFDKNLKDFHEFIEAARRYQKGKVKADLRYDAMIPVLEGKLPMMVEAAKEREIKLAITMAEEEKIKIVITGARQPGAALELLAAKKIPVILGKVLALPPEEDDPYDAAFTLPAQLHKAGVKFAFGTFDLEFVRNLPYQAAAAQAFGLPAEEALKAVTINAAEIWGVADKIGSIEKGKLADLIITDGDPLETKTQIKQMFIAGKVVDLDSSKHFKLYQKYMARP